MFENKSKQITTFKQTGIIQAIKKAGLGEFLTGVCYGIVLDGTLNIYNPEEDLDLFLMRLCLASLISDKYPQLVNRAREISDELESEQELEEKVGRSSESKEESESISGQPTEREKEALTTPLGKKKHIYESLIQKLSADPLDLSRLKLDQEECDVITEEVRPFLKEIKTCQEAWPNGANVSKAVQPKFLQQKGGLYRIDTLMENFQQKSCAESIELFLSCLSDLQYPFSLIFTSCNHSVSILFIPNLGLVFLNGNQMSLQKMVLKNDPQTIPTAIIPSLSFNGIAPCLVEILCAAENAPEIQKRLSKWITTEKEKPITPEDAKSKDNWGGSLLYIAVRIGDFQTVTKLLAMGADPNEQIYGGATPLFIAAQEGFFPIVQLLLDSGAKTDIPRKDGSTPIFVAVKNGFTNIVSLLIDKGADINVKWNEMTLLDVAKLCKHDEIVKLLETTSTQKYTKQV